MDLCGISQDAFDLIIDEETGGEDGYKSRPEWPGGQSGVTIGIGYDLGYSTPQQIALDWAPSVDVTTLKLLQSVSGIKGSPARSEAQSLHQVQIPWETALNVFSSHDLPRYTNGTIKALPNFDRLAPDSKGALVSLSFNRGYGCYDAGGDRYIECRAIKQHMINLEFDKIPDEFRDMKRLWIGKGLDGLLRRRDREADLFQKGLEVESV